MSELTTFPPSPTTPNAGVQDVLTIDDKTYIMQGSTPTDGEKSLEWTDQYDATIGSRQIDIPQTASISVIGEASAQVAGQATRFPLAIGSALTYRALRWKIKSIAEAGTYNGLTVWTISLERWKNWPLATSVLPDIPVQTAVALPVAPSTAEA